MTEEKLNELFQFARNSEPEISSKEISEWLAKAALAATVTGGVALGYKLVLTKKMIIMTMSALSLLGIGVLATGFFNETSNELEQSIAKVELTGKAVNNDDSAEELVATIEIPDDQTTHKSILNKNLGELEKLPLEKMTKFSSSLGLGDEKINIYTPPQDIITKKKDTLKTSESGYEIAVKSFSVLEIDGIFDVIIDQGETERVFVVSDNNDAVIAENIDNKLKLSSGAFGDKKGKCKEATVVHITVKNISKFQWSGIGNVLFDQVKLGDLAVLVTGVGDVEFFGSLAKLTVDASGVGNMSMEGSGQSASINFSGVGDLDMKNFLVDDLTLISSGIGNNYVHAKKTITINGTGVGDIVYMGGAAVKSMNFSGIGNIKSKD